MAPPRFYVGAATLALAVDRSVTLPDVVAHHAVRVVRLAVGDALTLFDGAGGEYRATLTAIDRRSVEARIEAFDPVERESSLRITLVQAIAANDAMDYAVRKAVELGVAAIAPVITARSAPLPPGERADKRVAHWQQVVVAACEQCGRNRVPAVATPHPLAQWRPSAGETAYVAAPDAKSTLRQAPQPHGGCAIVIGPEGGLTEAEIEALAQQGVHRLGLGPRVLRTETAAVAALAILQATWGDLA
jgi:16S rRNA (uracil1498-N3)-methyltransferase